MSVLATFVAFDVVTTGLDPEGGELIEVGAVRVSGGRLGESFRQLVRPLGQIPPQVARRTGISEQRLCDAPKAEEVVSAFEAFVGKAPLAGYDASFFEPFLDQHGVWLHRVYDVRELAQVALPRLVNHRLETLLGFFGMRIPRKQRAGSRARCVARVFMALAEHLKEQGLSVVQQLVVLSSGSASSLGEVFSAVALDLSKQALGQKIRRPTHPQYLRALFNVKGAAQRGNRPPQEEATIDIGETRSLFEEGGSLQQHLGGYELRPQQIRMTEAVCRAFNQSAFLVVEAGTGTGKSVAYLVPAIRWAVKHCQRVVVSTNTKNLQEQLFYKDIPQLESALGIPFVFVLLKGRANYLCLNKWRAGLSQPASTFTPQERKAALPLVVWSAETQTGDVAENVGFDRGRQGGLWAKVCSEPGYCLGQRCKFSNSCFLGNVRRMAQNAHILVVNHSLLFSDMASENAVLGEYEHLVLDEAHNVEKVATQYLGRELSIWRIRALVGRLYAQDVAEVGALVILGQQLARTKAAGSFGTHIASLIRLCQSLWREAQGLFEEIARVASQRFASDTPYTEKIRYKAEQDLFEPVSSRVGGFSKLLGRLISALEQLTQWLRELPDGVFPLQDESIASLQGSLSEAVEVASDLSFLTEAGEEDFVYWLELPSKQGSFDVRLYAAPLDISQRLSDSLYGQLRTMVLTSATLAVGGHFDYMLTRLGLDGEHCERVQTLAVGSPFDYESQVMLAVPGFVPSPKSPSFGDAVQRAVETLTTRMRRGTLVLFTAYGMLNACYDALKGKLALEDIQLLGQGRDGPRTRIMDEFRADASSVLFGTDSFWEGVDVAGPSLQMLIVVKLPFAVPTEPIVAAQMERLEKQGINPFAYYSLPEAVIRFRQGFGRLIRNRNDLGVVVILDHRVIKSTYGEVFLDSLPTQARRFSSEADMMAGISRWFGASG